MSEQPSGKTALAEALFEIGALRFGRFTLSSGKISSYYLDLRVVPSFPDTYSVVIQAYRKLAEGIGESRFDVLAGVATAGVVFSSPLALLLKKPMVYVRHEGKGHGLERLVEGAVRPGLRALVVDDIVTSGGSIASAAESLRGEGCKVTDALVLVDRLEGGATDLASQRIRLHAFTDIEELVESLRFTGKVTKKDYETVLRQMRSPRR